MKVLVTGGAGFIGSHLCDALIARGEEVICLDNFNKYYNPLMKEKNISNVKNHKNFHLVKGDILDNELLEYLFDFNNIDAIIHLAARAGVRPSLENPKLYEAVNVRGTLNLLEKARENGVKNFVFASSSSVYGGASKVPFFEKDNVDKPISPYAATKKSGELLCHTYHHLYGLNVACLRFFTVYGERGRPDMAPYKFMKRVMEGMFIEKYGKGDSSRDYTYVGDIVQGVIGALDNNKGYEIYNLGNSYPISLNDFIKTIEDVTQYKAVIKQKGMQAGDVHITYADITKAKQMIGYDPQTSLKEGMKRMYEWYCRTQPVRPAVSFWSRFWWFELQTKCPFCRTKMVEKGYPSDFVQAYKCLKCGYGDD